MGLSCDYSYGVKLHWRLQEIRNSGAVGYKYITVDEDEAANVIYANNVLIHLSNEQIPKGSAVSLATNIINSS